MTGPTIFGVRSREFGTLGNKLIHKLLIYKVSNLVCSREPPGSALFCSPMDTVKLSTQYR